VRIFRSSLDWLCRLKSAASRPVPGEVCEGALGVFASPQKGSPSANKVTSPCFLSVVTSTPVSNHDCSHYPTAYMRLVYPPQRGAQDSDAGEAAAAACAVCDKGASPHMSPCLPAFSARIKPGSFGVAPSFASSCFRGKEDAAGTAELS